MDNNIQPLLPLRLEPLFQMDDQIILSPSIPARYLVRQIGTNWFRQMEDIHHHTPIGTRLLIRRDIRGNQVVDYITTRVTRATFYGNWTHEIVSYMSDEATPYGFDLDCFRSRDDLLLNNYNQRMLFPDFPNLPALRIQLPALPALPAVPAVPAVPAQINPHGEGEPMWIDEQNPIFPISPPQSPPLSSSALFSFR